MSKKLAQFFFSLTIIILGPILLWNYKTIDYNSVVGACKIIIPAGLVMAGFGLLIGKVLETSTNGNLLGLSGDKGAQFNIDDLLIPPDEINESSSKTLESAFPSYLGEEELELVDNLQDEIAE